MLIRADPSAIALVRRFSRIANPLCRGADPPAAAAGHPGSSRGDIGAFYGFVGDDEYADMVLSGSGDLLAAAFP
jgi:hypothetical protein